MNKNLFIDMDAVAFFMQKKKIPVAELATKLDLNESTVQSYLDGAKQDNLPGTLPWRFAHALNVPVKVLLVKFYD